jgi:hypothetical protein
MTQNELEQFIDSNGMQAVLDMLVSICHEKAHHLRSNWQDETMARQWEQGAKRLDKASEYSWPL